jgi:hypothetical protein
MEANMPKPPRTLGKDPSFVVLLVILEEWETKDPKRRLRKAVTRRIHSFRERVKSLRSVGQPRHRQEFLDMLLASSRAEIAAKADWPENVKSHLTTCITTIYREDLRKTVPEVKAWNRARRARSRLANEAEQARLAALQP